MRSLPLARVAAASAAAAGATLLGVSLGGMAHVDRELAVAVTPPPAQTATFDRVAYHQGVEAGERRAARRAACLGERSEVVAPVDYRRGL